MTEERHSEPAGQKDALVAAEEKPLQAAENALRQTDKMMELIKDSIVSTQPFRLRHDVMLDLHRLCLEHVHPQAGQYRDHPVVIKEDSHVHHVPPPHQDVPGHVADLIDYVNDNWNRRTPLHLAAYVMWRLNWIHPFGDGNGRTTRAVSYYVLCSKLSFHIPGTTTIPELIADNKQPYYDALDAADTAWEREEIDVSEMEALLKGHLAHQLLEAIKRTEGPDASSPGLPPARTRDARPREAGRTTEMGLTVFFGGFAVAFLAGLILLITSGRDFPPVAKWLTVLFFSLSGALAFGFSQGPAGARGTIKLPNATGALRFNLRNGAALLVTLLVVSSLLLMWL